MQRKLTMVLCAILTLVLVLSVSAMAFATETDYVACNTSTNTMYEDVTVALAEATEGQTVKLLKDTSGAHVSVYDGSTLDLNGYTLTTNYFSGYGHIVDNSADNTGLLVPTRIMVDPNNAQLPVKDGEGYRFVEVLKFNAATQLDGSRYLFQPIFEEAAHAFLAAGAANSEVTIEVAVSWKDGEHTRIQRFVYSDNLVNGYIASYRGSNGGYGLAFGLTLENAANYTELSYDARVISSLNVVRSASNTNGAESENNTLTETVTIDHEQGNAVVAAGTLLESGTAELVLTATKLDETQSDITLGQDEELLSMDVHVEGISKDNTVPVIVTVNEMAPEFMNRGNITLYHVENGETVEMTRVYSLEEVDAHNEYYYDIETGTITMALATFSEIVTRTSTINTWGGEFDYSWYDAEATELKIANADQLAGFGAIVGGMAMDEEGNVVIDSFAGKAVKLVADINIGDTDSENDKMFYPIGYYNSTGSYEKVSGNPNGTAVSSGFKTFEGTFDGNGHTIANFYQNTWEAFGDYNDGYSGTPNHNRDGFGLFGKVYGGTVKNLTVKNFQSDGEFASTGTIAAYADCGATFENITIFECNPRVYNIGNGGIVGCVGWYNNVETDSTPVTFRNITVDASNIISALWGSWDVACGGLVGQYYPTSGQDSSIKNAGIEMINCHVAAQIDVNNDVCANYQYYAYRYAGMLIGSVRKNVTENGHSYPDMTGITFTDCSVNYEDWNDYYYCELVANSIASYTHDYQFSRLTVIDSIDEISDDNGQTWNTTGNYMTLIDGTRTCYHIMKDENGDLYRHEHDDSKTEVVGGVTIPVEDHRCIYLPFDQLVTGYGWGVTSKGIGEIAGVTVINKTASSEKFTGTAAESYYTGAEVKIGELFEAAVSEDDILDASVQVVVSPTANEDGTVTSTAGATYTANTTDWTQGTLTFTGEGVATITISDYYYCKTTSIEVTILPDYSGDYYIAGIRENETTYQYIMGVNDEKGRYDLEDSGSAELPESIPYGDAGKVFTLELTENGTYRIYAAGDKTKYLGWDSSNTENHGAFVTEEDALTVTIAKDADKQALYNIYFSATESEIRYLALNAQKGNTFAAWYKLGQTKDLALIPVTAVCTHETTTTTTIEATCTTTGSTTITCNGCGKIMSQETTPMDEHSYGDDGVCTTPGCGATEAAADAWTLVTNANNLKVGDQIVIVAKDSNYALSTTQNGNNRGQATVAKNGDTLGELGDDVQIITLQNGVNDGEFAFYVEGESTGYLYAASSGSNHLKTQDTLTVNSSWTITIDSNGVATIMALSSTNRNWLRYNSSNNPPIFSCYSSGQADIVIYMKPACVHSYVDIEAVAPTCTEVGYTACQQCTKCNAYAGREEIAAFGHTLDDGTVTTEASCTTDGVKTYKCSVCSKTETEVIEASGHNYVDGTCSKCGEEDPNAGGSGEVVEDTTITFSLGANGSASHNDGSSKTTYSETAGDYTLNITGGTNFYTGARDAKGNSCFKLGTSSKTASFTFTVPDNVDSVVIYVAKYKANTSKVSVNDTTYTLENNSNDGLYDTITIDTTTTKTITVTTVSGGVRAMVNTIEFVIPGTKNN